MCEVEQGPRLESQRKKIGVVHGVSWNYQQLQISHLFIAYEGPSLPLAYNKS